MAARYGAPPSSCPAVIVLDANDIVLAEITAGLNLDKFEIDLAGVGEAMGRADRQIDRFVLMDVFNPAIKRHLGGAAHHHPMLRPMMVLLQGQAPAGPDDDALNLVARALVDAL